MLDDDHAITRWQGDHVLPERNPLISVHKTIQETVKNCKQTQSLNATIAEKLVNKRITNHTMQPIDP